MVYRLPCACRCVSIPTALLWLALEQLRAIQAATVTESCRPLQGNDAHLYALARAAIDKRTCVPYDDSVLGSAVAAKTALSQANASCPTFSRRYLQAAGVSLLPLPSEDDLKNATLPSSGDEFVDRLRWTVCFLSRMFGRELEYFRAHRTTIVELMETVQWDGSTAPELARRVDLLTCSTLFPPCDVIDGELLEVRPCEWFCEDVRKAVLPAARAMAAQPQHLPTNGLYNILSLAVERCVPNGAETDSLKNGTSMAASPPRCQNCTNTGCEALSVTTMTPGTSAVRGPAGRLCFNATNVCVWPFVPTSVSSHWNDDVQDRLRSVTLTVRAFLNMSAQELPLNGSVMPCARDCQTTIVLSEREERNVRSSLRVLSWMVFAGGLFALGSFFIDWRRMNRYPKRILLYLNGCVFIGNFGNIAQDFANSPDSYLCHADGSVRYDEPNDSFACTVLFTILYFFLMSSVAWWVCLAHAWHVTLPCIKQPDFGRTKNAHFERWYHLFTWPIILTLTIAQLANKEVGGSTLYGICWMYRDIARFGYMVIPITFASILGAVFLGLGMYSFYRSRRSWQRSMTTIRAAHNPGTEMTERGLQAKKKRKKRGAVEKSMRHFLIQLWILLIGVLLHMVAQVVVGAYRRNHWDSWIHQVDQRLTCLLSTCHNAAVCPSLPTPSVALLAIPVAAAGTFAITTYIWVFNMVTMKRWKDVCLRLAHALKTRTRPSLSDPMSTYTANSCDESYSANARQSPRTVPSALYNIDSEKNTPEAERRSIVANSSAVHKNLEGSSDSIAATV